MPPGRLLTFFLFFFPSLVIYFERERMQAGEGHREERDRESQAGSEIHVEPDVGLNPRSVRS